jgi:hypothetical protein
MAKTMFLKNIPEDVMCILKQEQKQIKAQKEVKVYGLELTLYYIIRQSKRCNDANAKQPVKRK